MVERIKTRCPSCKERLKLRMPPGTRRGQFTFTCEHCKEHFMIDIPDTRSSQLDVIAISGSRDAEDGHLSRKASGPAGGKKSRVTVERGPSKVMMIAKDREKQYRRLTVAMVLLLLTGGLGILYSTVNIANSFAIKDIEQQSSGGLASLSVWVIDSQNGRSIENVNVSVSSDGRMVNGYTDSEGLVVIDGLEAGRTTLNLSTEGYVSCSGEIYIKTGTPNVLDIPMTQGDTYKVEPLPIKQFEARSTPFILTDLMAIVMMLSAFMGFLGAYFIYRREFFLLALGLAFLSAFSVGFVIGAIFSVIAIFLLITSYKGFSHTYELKWLLERVGREDIRRFFSQADGDEPKFEGLPPVRRK